jgi:hypothetical protein
MFVTTECPPQTLVIRMCREPEVGSIIRFRDTALNTEYEHFAGKGIRMKFTFARILMTTS